LQCLSILCYTKNYEEDSFETLAYNVNGVKHFVFLTNGTDEKLRILPPTKHI